MLQVNDLTKIYDGKNVVDGVCFGVARGATLALLGESGCGKTTTLKMINRLIEPSAGEVFIDGKPAAGRDPVRLRRSIGYVIQENGLFPHYTVAENVAVGPHLLGYTPERIRTAVAEVLERVELPAVQFAAKYPAELSGGQQQRVAIARAIITRPPLLLMDEPFSALDPITRAEARMRFLQLIRQYEIAVVLVTHDLAEAVQLADHICLMKEGRIIQQGDVRDLLYEPADAFVTAFFQHHRFETELKITTLADLLPFLTLAPAAADGNIPVDTGSDLYSLLTAYSSRSTAVRFQVQDTAGVNLGQTTMSALVQAFFAYKMAA